MPDEMAQYETALETTAAYIGHMRREIWSEQEKKQPNQNKLIALEAQVQVVLKERHDVTPGKSDLIRKALCIYAPILKTHWSNPTQLIALMKECQKRYPSCWQDINDFRKQKGKQFPDWPDWCFIPADACTDIIRKTHKQLKIEHGYDVSNMAAFAAWRINKSVYRFHPVLYEELFEMSINALPGAVLRNLPQYGCYVETPSHPVYQGFFAHLDYAPSTGQESLRLVMDVDGSYSKLVPQLIFLNGTLEEGIRAVNDLASERAKQHGLRTPDKDSTEREVRSVSGLVSLLLYLCSVGADCVLDAPARKSHKLAAEEPSLWQVGSQIAIELEKHGVRSHVRRAHWHGYWTGAGRKNFELRWLHPILVKGREEMSAGPDS